MSSGRGSTSAGSGSVSGIYLIAYYKRLSKCIHLCCPNMLQLKYLLIFASSTLELCLVLSFFHRAWKDRRTLPGGVIKAG